MFNSLYHVSMSVFKFLFFDQDISILDQLVDVADTESDIQMFISTHRRGSIRPTPPFFEPNAVLVLNFMSLLWMRPFDRSVCVCVFF